MKQSAGTLLYRTGTSGLEVLLVHPSGGYNRNKPWSIPKGVPDEGEGLEDAARRETREETGVISGPLVALGSIQYVKSRKQVHCFAGEGDSALPCCASWEVDRAEFVPLEAAYDLLHPDQHPFLDRLKQHLVGQEFT